MDIIKRRKKQEYIDYPLACFTRKYKNSSVLFSARGKFENFTTETLDIHFIKNSRQPNFKNLDGFLTFQDKIPIKYALINRKRLSKRIAEQYGNWKNYLLESFKIKNFFQEMPLMKIWNFSIVSAVIFGMFLMTFIYRHLGQKVSADSPKVLIDRKPEMVLGESTAKKTAEDYVAQIIQDYEKESVNEKFVKDDIKKMTKGYPIEKMAPFIAKQDKLVAAFLIGIAKKESNWGRRVPVLNSQDCYNYWGYRGIRKKMSTDGYTCFDSPEDAVKTVSKRLKTLISEENLTTPKKMVVAWKCGWDCSWDNPAAVKKWVSDVDYYFEKFEEL